MSKVVKFYYTRPLIITKAAFVPIFEEFLVPKKGVKRSVRHTIAAVYDDEKQTISFGLATCHVNDQFVKEIGRKLATERAELSPFCQITDFTGTFKEFLSIVREVGAQKEYELIQKDYKSFLNGTAIYE